MSDTRDNSTRAWRRAGAWGAAAFVGLPLAIVLGLWALAQSEPGRRWIADAAVAAIGAPGDMEVSIARLDGPLPQTIRLSGLRIRDAAGEWLSAETVALDWAPLALLSGELRVTSLRATDLTLERLPADTAEPDARQPGGLPRLPLPLVVEHVSVADLTLGPAIMGERASFRIDGKVAAQEADGLTSTLTVARTDGVPARANVSARYTPRDDRLRLDAKVDEPPGGLIARLLDLPDLPHVRLSLAGDGPIRDWRGDLAVEIEGLASADATVKLDRGEAIGFDVAGAARLTRPAGGPAGDPVWAVLAGDYDFALAGQWGEDRVLRIERGRVEGPGARLAVTGILVADTLEVDAQASAEVKDPALVGLLVPDVSLDTLNLTARATGRALQPALSASLTASRLRTPDVDVTDVRVRASFRPALPFGRGPIEGPIEADGTLARLSIAGLDSLAPLLDEGARWSLTGRLGPDAARIEVDDLVIETAAARLTASGALGLREETLEAAIRLSLPDLAALTPLVGLGVKGNADIDAWIEAAGFGREANAILTAGVREGRVGAPALDALLGGNPTLAADLRLNPDGSVEARDIALDTPTARLTGSVRLSEDFARLDASYELAVPDLAVLAKPLGVAIAGRGTLRGRAEGRSADPTLQGRLAVERAAIEGIALHRGEADYTAEALATAPRGRVDFSATTPLGELSGATAFALADPELRLTDLALRGNGATAIGALTIPIDGRPLAGALDVAADDLGPWLALAGLTGGGSASGKVSLAADGARQAATLDARVTAPVLRLGPDRVLRADTARIGAALRDAFAEPSGTARLELTGTGMGEARLAKLTLEAEGGLTDLGWRVAADGAFRGPFVLEADGRLRFAGDALSVDVAALKGLALGQDVALRAPVSFSRQGAALALGPLDLGYGGAVLKAEGKIDAASLLVNLSATALPLGSLDPILPTGGLTGTVAADLAIEGPRANPVGTARLRVSDLDVVQVLQGPILGVDLDAEWRDGRVRVAGRIAGMPGDDARLAAELPLRLAPDTLSFDVPADQPVSADLGWQGEMASIWPLVPVEGHQVAGKTELSLRATGTVAAPRLSGALTVSAGSYENLDTGTVLKDLNLTIDFDDDRARLSELSATDGAQGRLSGSGQVEIDAAAGYPLALNLRMTRLAVLRRDDVSATADGTVDAAGSLDGMTLTGRFQTHAVEVRLIDRLPPEIVTLEVVETDGSDTGLTTQAGPSGPDAAGQIELDIAVDMPRRVFVRGRGLDSEWAGQLTVTGPADAPIIAGEVNLVRGQLSLLTKTFRLTKGSVRFPGGAEPIPVLDVAAEHRAGDVTVTARVSGPATNPTIGLSSVPELSQDEIISRVLFNKNRGQLTALEGAQLAAAVAELSGARGGASILDFARGLLGVDVLRVGSTVENGVAGAAVEAGKYAAEGVYVGVKKGVTDQTGAVAVEIELTPNISVESETGTSGESDIGIKFKWDY